ncbi:MAG: hypothetical protein U0N63_02215 [Senegalimassilia anaerobia]|uniref:hypothetical protein n=1 Tax=Senegalimassilia anaerobia TaxID=1473216 RepID=UPI002F9392D7
MTAKLPKTVTPALMRKLNNAHMSRMETCDAECAGVGYCEAVWRSAYRQENEVKNERKCGNGC